MEQTAKQRMARPGLVVSTTSTTVVLCAHCRGPVPDAHPEAVRLGLPVLCSACYCAQEEARGVIE